MWKIKYQKAAATHSTRHPTQERRGGQRFTGLLPSHLEIQPTDNATRSGRHSHGAVSAPTPVRSFQPDVVASIPTAKSFPSGLIPRFFASSVAELRGGSSWELIQCSQAARAAGKTWRRKSRRSRTAANPSPRHGTGSGALSGMGFHLRGVLEEGGGEEMCTSYPSCHSMFGFRQPWECSPRAPRSHRAQHLYILVCFIMTAGRPWGKFDTLCTMNFGFCLLVSFLFPKVWSQVI